MKRYVMGIMLVLVIVLITAGASSAQMGGMMYRDDVSPTPTGATANEEHVLSVDQAMQAILDTQHVSSVDKLDLTTVSDDQWEVLGDAVMEQIHPGDTHEAMDQMMGGEGSESLRQMHINMGQAYLGYRSANQSNVRYGMMGRWNAAATPMMAGYGPMAVWSTGVWGWFGVIQAVTWLAGILFLVTGSAYFVHRMRTKK